jgi:hypothetical protein
VIADGLPAGRSRIQRNLSSRLTVTGTNVLGCSIADRAAPINGNYRIVERVIDGDTLVMGNGERVRLIGVDSPETKHPRKPVEHFGKEAAAFTTRMLEGKRVRLEFDPANAPRAHKDSTQQRRTLASCSWRMAPCSMRRLLKRAKASLTRAFLLHGWTSSGDLKERRGLWAVNSIALTFSPKNFLDSCDDWQY